MSERAVLLVLLASASCSEGRRASAVCDAYVACAHAATPITAAQVEALFGKDGSCFAEGGDTVPACEQQCRGGLDVLRASHPEIASCTASAGSDAGTGDGAVQPVATTPHAIDVDPPNGSLGAGAAVALSEVVVVTPVEVYDSDGKTTCSYAAIIQDPLCVSPPCGIAIQETSLPKLGASCPLPADSTSKLATLKPGDNIDVTGIVGLFPSTMNGTTVVRHEIEVSRISPAGAFRTVTPRVLADGSIFVSYTGSGWAMYEGTYVQIKSATKLTISSVDTASPYHFHTLPGDTDWGTTYRFAYRPSGVSDFPAVNAKFTSISGVVSNLFGGAVLPTTNDDFVP